jgi:hypothetical protein
MHDVTGECKDWSLGHDGCARAPRLQNPVSAGRTRSAAIVIWKVLRCDNIVRIRAAGMSLARERTSQMAADTGRDWSILFFGSREEYD